MAAALCIAYQWYGTYTGAIYVVYWLQQKEIEDLKVYYLPEDVESYCDLSVTLEAELDTNAAGSVLCAHRFYSKTSNLVSALWNSKA